MMHVGVAMARGTGKSQNLTVRLDEKTRFALEYVSRRQGQALTSVIEKLIILKATDLSSGGWVSLWHPNEGVRVINLLLDSQLEKSSDDEMLFSFLKIHWDLFSKDHELAFLIEGNITVLWGNIRQYVDFWLSSRSKDYWRAWRQMADALLSAGLEAPRKNIAPSLLEEPFNG